MGVISCFTFKEASSELKGLSKSSDVHFVIMADKLADFTLRKSVWRSSISTRTASFIAI